MITFTDKTGKTIYRQSCDCCGDFTFDRIVYFDRCYAIEALIVCADCAEWLPERFTCPRHGDVD